MKVKKKMNKILIPGGGSGSDQTKVGTKEKKVTYSFLKVLGSAFLMNDVKTHVPDIN